MTVTFNFRVNGTNSVFALLLSVIMTWELSLSHKFIKKASLHIQPLEHISEKGGYWITTPTEMTIYDLEVFFSFFEEKTLMMWGSNPKSPTFLEYVKVVKEVFCSVEYVNIQLFVKQNRIVVHTHAGNFARGASRVNRLTVASDAPFKMLLV